MPSETVRLRIAASLSLSKVLAWVVIERSVAIEKLEVSAMLEEQERFVELAMIEKLTTPVLLAEAEFAAAELAMLVAVGLLTRS